jgi:hypothetical protein
MWIDGSSSPRGYHFPILQRPRVLAIEVAVEHLDTVILVCSAGDVDLDA